MDETKEFLACRGRKLHLFPGSMLFKKPPQWVMLAENGRDVEVVWSSGR